MQQFQHQCKETTILIPTLNEEKNIKPLLSMIKELYPTLPIVVIDDGSTDNTQEAAKQQGAEVINRSHESTKGIAASIIAGAQRITTQYFIVMDGDFQHPPEKIKEMLEKLQHYELVIGKRVKIANEWPIQRRLMSMIAMFLGRLRLYNKPYKCCDLMSGFFAINTKLFLKTYLLHKNNYNLEGYKILFMTLKYLPRKITYTEVPYVFGERKYGDSKINKKQVWIYLKSLC